MLFGIGASSNYLIKMYTKSNVMEELIDVGAKMWGISG